MITVGLTGGIGAGKSTVAQLLVGHGAVLVDADLIAREVVAPGGPAFQPMIDRFGVGIVGSDGLIDRPKVAELVFGHPEALADLNAITHPAIGVEMIARKDRYAATDEIVVLDIPLL
jgi:dephospho-CoA kinase